MTASLARDATRPHARPSRDFAPAIMLSVVACVSVVILAHLGVVVWLSLFEGAPTDPEIAYGLGNFTKVFADPFTWEVIGNTLMFSLATLVVALGFGVPAAWLMARTDLRAKTLLFTLMTIGLLIPGFTVSMGWLFLLHPRIGLANRLLDELFGAGPLDIASNIGMGWVQGLNLAPLAFVMTAAVFRATDPRLEEAALMCGAPFRATWWRVTLRLCWPGILAAAIFIFTIGFAAFDVPAIIGWGSRRFTFSTYVLTLTNSSDGLPKYGTAAALSALVIAAALGFGWWYATMQKKARRYEVITGKGYQPRLLALRGWAGAAWGFLGLYVLLAKVLPLLVLGWAAFLPFLQLPDADAIAALSFANFTDLPWELIGRGARNTATLMILVPIVTVVLSFAFSWVVLRSRVPGRTSFDFIAFLPHAVPNILFGVGALLIALFAIDKAVPVYGTVWILLIVFTVARLSYGTRMTNATLIQISRELDESAAISGAGTWGVVSRILAPLMAPALIYAALWIALLVYRELTLAILLTTSGNFTLPVLIWNQFSSGRQGHAAALSLLMLLVMTPLIGAFLTLARRRGLIASG